MTDKNQRKLQLFEELGKVQNELRPFVTPRDADSPWTWTEADLKKFEENSARMRAIMRQIEGLERS